MQIFERLNEIEENFDLKELSANGIWVYPIIKHILHLHFSSNISVQPTKKKMLSSNLDSIKWGLKNKKLENYDILISVNSFSRRKINDKYQLIYSDFLYDTFSNRKILTFESPSGIRPNHYENVNSKSIYYPDIDYLKCYAKTTFNHIDSVNESVVRQLLDKLEIKTDLYHNIFKKLNRFFVFSNYFRKILNNIKPKAVIVICSYSYLNAALILASKQLKIPVIEFQHGHIGETHPGYIYKQVYERKLFPDYLFTFGDYFTQLIKTESKFLEEDKIITVGYPFLEGVKRESTNISQLNLEPKTKYILFTSQWANRDELKVFVSKLARILPARYGIIFKPHPKEENIATFYSEFNNNDNIILIKDKSFSSFDGMKLCKIHSTVWSTSFYEANYFNLPNIFVYVEGYSNMIEKHVDDKVNFMAKSVEEYVEILNRIETIEKSVKNEKENLNNKYFQQDALENMHSQIDLILNKIDV